MSAVHLEALTLVLRLAISAADCVAACPAQPGEELIKLGVGTQKVITLDPDWSGTSISGTIVVHSLNRGSQLLVIGDRSGRGDLVVSGPKGARHFVFHVTRLDLDQCGVSDWWKRLPCGGDFDVETSPEGRLRIKGTYRTFEDLLKLLELAAEHPFLTIPVAPRAMVERAFGEANAALFLAGLPVQVGCKGAELFVEPPPSPELMGQAREVVARYPHLPRLCALASPVP